jgi:multiple antibiotic resistance protein
MIEVGYIIKLFAGLVAVLNPVGAIPVFASLTEHRSPAEKAATARTAALTVATVLLVSAFCGEHLLHFFGISIASFRVGGGILILFMAIAMLHARRTGAKQSREERKESLHREDVAVVPLGIPLMAGPGSISTVILYRHEASTWAEYFALIMIILSLALLVFLALRFSPPIINRLGRMGMNIIVRVMGLILAAIAVEFITGGLLVLLPGLG